MSKHIVAIILILAINLSAQPPKDTVFYQDVSWSPDGTNLLMSRLDISGDNYEYHIYSVNTDGSNYQKLTDGPNDIWTSWSPDGSKFVHASKKENNTDIWIRGFDSAFVIQLTTDTTRDSHPDWSPDGSSFAFVSKKNGLTQIYTMNTAGDNAVMLTRDSIPKDNPRWSPDGKRIAYFGNVSGRDSIFVIDSDGNKQTGLCEGVWPSWSPDGKSILFTIENEIYQMKIGDSVKTKVIDNAYYARWSPDGKKIAFIRNTWRADEGWPATSAVFIVNADGTNERRVTP